jgi:hypothetical protein
MNLGWGRLNVWTYHNAYSARCAALSNCSSRLSSSKASCSDGCGCISAHVFVSVPVSVCLLLCLCPCRIQHSMKAIVFSPGSLLDVSGFSSCALLFWAFGLFARLPWPGPPAWPGPAPPLGPATLRGLEWGWRGGAWGRGIGLNVA